MCSQAIRISTAKSIGIYSPKVQRPYIFDVPVISHVGHSGCQLHFIRFHKRADRRIILFLFQEIEARIDAIHKTIDIVSSLYCCVPAPGGPLAFCVGGQTFFTRTQHKRVGIFCDLDI